VARSVGRHIADVTPKMQKFPRVMTERHTASHPPSHGVTFRPRTVTPSRPSHPPKGCDGCDV
jgi:hypothetical protein